MRREEIISICLDEIQGGKSTVKDCLLKYPYLKDELEPLIEIGLSIHPVEAVPSPEFKQRLRYRLISCPKPKLGIFHWFMPAALLRRAKLALVALGLVPVFALGGTTVYAYGRSLPDESLYPLKRAIETVEISLASDHETKARVHLKMAERRSEEIVAQTKRGRTPSAATVERAARQIDSALREISQVKAEDARLLLGKLSESTLEQQVKLGEVLEIAPEPSQSVLKQAIETSRRGALIAQITRGNSSFLGKSPSVSDTRLETTHFRLEGTVTSISGTTWTVDGVVLHNVTPPPGTVLPLNSTVKIEGVAHNNQVFIAKIEKKNKDEESDEVKIKGVFNGTSADGATWYVGGLPVAKPNNLAVPPPGTELTIEGTVKGRVFDVAGAKAEEPKAAVSIRGTLASVNSGQRSITLEAGGSRIVIDISRASILSGDKKPLTLTDLSSLGRADLKVEDLYKKDGLLYARKIYVDTLPARKQSPQPKRQGSEPGKEAKKEDDTIKTNIEKENKEDGRTGIEKPAPTPEKKEQRGTPEPGRQDDQKEDKKTAEPPKTEKGKDSGDSGGKGGPGSSSGGGRERDAGNKGSSNRR